MTEILIDGQRYVPETSNTYGPKIGVAITTMNRNKVVQDVYEKWRAKTPEAFPVIIVDDASTIPVENATYRFEKNAGIARAKNKSLELLEDLGVEEFFLVDDDCWPIIDEWWKPYIDSPEPHLMAIFEDVSKPQKMNDLTKLYQDENHIAWSGARGYMVYVNKKILEVVGGMDPIYGKWGWEHCDWSCRIHARGLTSWRYADVVDGESIFYSMDQHLEINRSVSNSERQAAVITNSDIFKKRRDSNYDSYVEYRELEDVVITCLYGKNSDPQRPGSFMNSKALLEPLLNSLKGVKVVLYTDLDIQSTEGVEVIKSDLCTNVFFQRHLNAYQYLRGNTKVRYAWCVDATDVELLKNPFQEMASGILYTGWEPTTINNEWLLKNHPTDSVQELIRAKPSEQLLNAGVFGGDRATMIEFTRKLYTYFTHNLETAWIAKGKFSDLGDMGGFQVVAQEFKDRLEWGSKVTTIFKANERSSGAWWKHK